MSLTQSFSSPNVFRIVAGVDASLKFNAATCPTPLRPFSPLVADNKTSLEFTVSLASLHLCSQMWNELHTDVDAGLRRPVTAEWKPSPQSSCKPFQCQTIGYASEGMQAYEVKWSDRNAPTLNIKKIMRKNCSGFFETNCVYVSIFRANKFGNKAGTAPVAEFCIDLSRYTDCLPGHIHSIEGGSKSFGTAILYFNVNCSKPQRSSSSGIVDASPENVTRPRKFPAVLLFFATFDQHLDSLRNMHVRLSSNESDLSLLQIGCSFEVCCQDAPDCFGQVTECKKELSSSILQILVAVAPGVVYLPCVSAHNDGLITEVYHVFAGKLGEARLKIDIERRHAAIRELESLLFVSNKSVLQDVNFHILDLKREGISRSKHPIQLTADELGMVRLRQGFLFSQPFISAVVKWLMSLKQWYGSCCDDVCIRFFRSSDGPWDIFSIFNFFLRRKTPNKLGTKDIFVATVETLAPHGCNELEKDAFRARLEGIFLDIFCVRNWWAHLGATHSDCLRALQAIKDFVNIVKFSSNFQSRSIDEYDDCNVCPQLIDADRLLEKMDCLMCISSASAHISIDDISYLFFLRACQKLCKFCTDISVTLPFLEFSKLLMCQLKQKGLKAFRRQSEFIEVTDVAAALCKLTQEKLSCDFCFDCNIIRSTRNTLSHASDESNRVILVLIALGAIARVLKFILDDCLTRSCLPAESLREEFQNVELLLLQGRAFHRDTTLSQVELLARSDFCDIDKAIVSLFVHQKEFIEKCPFKDLICNVEETKVPFRVVQFLLDQKISGLCDIDKRLESLKPSETIDSVKARLRSLLHLIARIPPCRTQSLDDALAWLLEPQNPGLYQCCGLNLLLEDFKNGIRGFFFSRYVDLKDSAEYGVAAEKYNKFCEAYTSQQFFALKFQKLIREYEMACFSSQKFRYAEDEFRLKHCEQLSNQANINIWNDRLLFLEEHNKNEKMQPLIFIAKNVTEILTKYISNKQIFDALSETKAYDDVFFFLKISVLWAATLMKTYVPDAGCEGWELLKFAAPIALNVFTNSSISSVCKSGPFFHFHRSVIQSRHSHDAFDALFSRSKTILQPMLSLVGVDLATDVNVIEESLGLSLFDAIVHLVALASTTLHDVFGSVPDVPVETDSSAHSGMNASIKYEGLFLGRTEEIAKIKRCIQPVFQCDDSTDHGTLVLVHGNPGTGKSRLVMQQFELLQRRATGAASVFCHVIQGRTSESVLLGLYTMGLSLSKQLEIGLDCPVDRVLKKLNCFLSTERYAILADDVDDDSFAELLKHVPKSRKPCALIVTSQFGSVIIKNIDMRTRENDFVFNFFKGSDTDIELDRFNGRTSLELVGRTCLGLQYEEFRRLLDLEENGGQRKSDDDKGQKFEYVWRLRNWLSVVLENDCANLPIAVQNFSRWFEHEASGHHSDSETKTRWSIAVREEGIEADASFGNRGLDATFRLNMHTIAARYPEQIEACRQLCGLLCLCPLNKIPWSFFDGCNGSNKKLSALLIRGALVEVAGKPLKYISPINERCKIMRLANGADSVAPETAYVTSDVMVDGNVMLQHEDGYITYIPIEDLEFRPHIVGMVHPGRNWLVACHLMHQNRFTLRYAMPIPATGIKFIINKPGDMILHKQEAMLMSHNVLDVQDINPHSTPTISVKLCNAAIQSDFDRLRYSQLLPEGWITDLSLRKKESMWEFPPIGFQKGKLKRNKSSSDIRKEKHLAKSLQELRFVSQKSMVFTAPIHAVVESLHVHQASNDKTVMEDTCCVQENESNIRLDTAKTSLDSYSSIFISGAVGPYASDINGFYRPVQEMSDDVKGIQYSKWGDDKMCVVHRSGMWQVKIVNHEMRAHKDSFLAYVIGSCAIEDCASCSWRVWDGNEFTDQPCVKLLTGPEAEQRSSIFLPNIQLELQHAQFPPEVRIIDRRIFIMPNVEAVDVDSSVPAFGRVFAYHRQNPIKEDTDLDTVSVIFGCDTGYISDLKPGAVVKRFQACHVHLRPTANLNPALRSPECLHEALFALDSTGFVCVDYIARTFNMHQMHQNSIIRCLGLKDYIAPMISLLEATFGDPSDYGFNVDSRQVNVMMESLETAHQVVRTMRTKGLPESRPFWCSSMFLRLRRVALFLKGNFRGLGFWGMYLPEESLEYTLEHDANVCLIGDMVFKHLVQNRSASIESSMTLDDLLNEVPHIQNHCDDADLLKSICCHSFSSAYLMIEDKAHCSDEYECLSVWALSSHADFDFQWRPDDNWNFRLLRWHFPPSSCVKRTLKYYATRLREMLEVYETQDDAIRLWEVSIALGNEFLLASSLNKNEIFEMFFLRSIILHERALRMHIDTLNEEHCHTAHTVYSMGNVYFCFSEFDKSIELQKWCFRMRNAAVSDDPDTEIAKSWSRIGNAYEGQERFSLAISSYRQALEIYGRLFGADMKHPFAAQIIMRLSRSYHRMGLTLDKTRAEIRNAHFAESERLREQGMQILSETLSDLSTEYQRWESQIEDWEMELDDLCYEEETPSEITLLSQESEDEDQVEEFEAKKDSKNEAEVREAIEAGRCKNESEEHYASEDEEQDDSKNSDWCVCSEPVPELLESEVLDAIEMQRITFFHSVVI